ncbi:MAG: ADP-ribosylglycohydrolase family protein [Myxococcaceae bacterium]
MKPKNEDRAQGALLGLAVGDALGTTLEFKNLSAPAFPTMCDGPHREVVGGGPFQVKAGQVTDDTQMATALANSLRLLKRFDPEDVLARYREWLPHAFDVGVQTRSVLEAYDPRLGPFHAAKSYWDHNGRKPAANGSLMRTAPIGVYFAEDREARIKASLEDSRLTHADPRCALSCVAFNGAIAAAVAGHDDVRPEMLVTAALSDLSIAGAQLGRMMPDAMREVQDATRVVREDLELARAADPRLYGPEIHLHHHAGFVRVAFRLAFWELFHAPSFEAALVDVVNRGNDADTNGAIAGALLGAAYGEAAIPPSWRNTVLGASPAGRVWRDVYHPTQLLLLA